MKTYVYCSKTATTTDAIGLDTCQGHADEANDYHESVTGRNPNDDAYEYCHEHSDMWEPGCKRCETCSQHHYRKTVQQFLDSPVSHQLQIHSFDNHEEMITFLSTPQRFETPKTPQPPTQK